MIIEETLLAYLTDVFHDEGLPVYAMTPKQDVPRNYIVIDKTGSGRRNGIDRATVAIQSISSDSLLKAVEINEDVIKAMEEISREENIFSAYLQADYNFTNTTTKQYRYQAVYEIYYKR